jgi:hypothetical protein
VPAQAQQAGVTKSKLDALKANPTHEGGTLIGQMLQNFFCSTSGATLPAGTIFALDGRIQRYRIAIPQGSIYTGQLSGPFGLVPAIDDTRRPYTEVVTSGVKPTSGTEVPLPDYEAALLPVWYKRPVFIALMLFAAAAAGGGVYYYVRKPKTV